MREATTADRGSWLLCLPDEEDAHAEVREALEQTLLHLEQPSLMPVVCLLSIIEQLCGCELVLITQAAGARALVLLELMVHVALVGALLLAAVDEKILDQLNALVVVGLRSRSEALRCTQMDADALRRTPVQSRELTCASAFFCISNCETETARLARCSGGTASRSTAKDGSESNWRADRG